MEAFFPNFYERAKHCEFGAQRDEQVKDKSLLQKLQMKSDLNLDTAIEMAHQ